MAYMGMAQIIRTNGSIKQSSSSSDKIKLAVKLRNLLQTVIILVKEGFEIEYDISIVSKFKAENKDKDDDSNLKLDTDFWVKYASGNTDDKV
jgi:hypothetical protein